MGSPARQTDRIAVVVGVDGSGRTHRLESLAAESGHAVARVQAPEFQISSLASYLASHQKSEPVVLLVDDAHRLPDPTLVALADAARAGLPMLLARRPTIDRPALAELDEVVAAGGRVEELAAMGPEQVGVVVAAVTGRLCDAETARVVWLASAGLPGIAAAISSGPSSAPGVPTPALLARIQRRLALLGSAAADTAQVLALRLDLPDDALARAGGLARAELEPTLRALRDEGFLTVDGEHLVPAVAEALLTDLTSGQRRRMHDTVARALVSVGAPPLLAAGQLRAARARGAEAGAAYLAAADHLRFSDPAAATGWYEDALDAGIDDAAVAAGRAEAAALLGMSVDPDRPGLPSEAAGRLARAAGAGAAHEGRADRAGLALLATAAPGPALAVGPLMGAGQLEQARAAAQEPAPTGIRLLAEAALASTEPADALPLAIEAAEAVERVPPSAVLPDTPHALGAVLAVTAGDVATAVHLLQRALEHQVGGPVAAVRHRLLSAWASMRAGQPEVARDQLRKVTATDLGGRDRVLHAAVQAGLARRSGDIAGLRQAWPAVERVLARRGLDLFQLEASEELMVAAARLRRVPRTAASLTAFDSIVEGLGAPPAWVVTLGWLRLQMAIALDDAAGAGVAAARIVAVSPLGDRQLAQQAAAGVWAAALAGDVDTPAVLAAAEGLAMAEMPWEASRLAGDAAIRVADAGAARRLLERARDLTGPETATSVSTGRDGDPVQQAGLSEREVEVATLVLAGRTHKEIGAQLYIAPKTVEHHVARIRTKLGATSRAEFVATLHTLFDAGGGPPAGPYRQGGIPDAGGYPRTAI